MTGPQNKHPIVKQAIDRRTRRRGLARLWPVWVLPALALAGCSLLGNNPSVSPSRYTLDAPAASTTRPAAAPHYPLTLDLRSIRAPGWLDSKRMLYRLEYDQGQRLAAYTRSAWADMPADLVGDHLEGALSARHLFAAVLGQGSGRADLVLQLALQDFSQYFTARDASHGRIAAQATLLSADNGAVIAQKHFDISAPAPSADAEGGVQALSRADARLDRVITDWLTDTLAACGDRCQRGA